MRAVARYLGHAHAAFMQWVYGRFSRQQAAQSGVLLAARVARVRASLTPYPHNCEPDL